MRVDYILAIKVYMRNYLVLNSAVSSLIFRRLTLESHILFLIISHPKLPYVPINNGRCKSVAKSSMNSALILDIKLFTKDLELIYTSRILPRNRVINSDFILHIVYFNPFVVISCCLNSCLRQSGLNYVDQSISHFIYKFVTRCILSIPINQSVRSQQAGLRFTSMSQGSSL